MQRNQITYQPQPINWQKQFIIPILALSMLVIASLACDIDQNFGDLVPDSTPQVFEPAVAENHTWTASVTPNVKYEVVISIQPNKADLEGFSSLWVRDAKGNNQYAFVRGAVTAKTSLATIFIAPPDGKILILFIPDRGRTTCTIQLKQVQP